jgi:hypothetical protein
MNQSPKHPSSVFYGTPDGYLFLGDRHEFDEPGDAVIAGRWVAQFPTVASTPYIIVPEFARRDYVTRLRIGQFELPTRFVI